MVMLSNKNCFNLVSKNVRNTQNTQNIIYTVDFLACKYCKEKFFDFKKDKICCKCQLKPMQYGLMVD